MSENQEQNTKTPGRKNIKATLKRRYLRWEELTIWPMFILSLLFVVISVLLVANPAEISSTAKHYMSMTIPFLWAIFIADYIVRLAISANKKEFFLTHFFELLSLAVPYLRPFLIIRYFWRLSYFHRRGSSGMRAKTIISASLFTLFFTYTLSTAVWLVERGTPKANILNWGDAIWWGFTTISTVGYGDFYPITGWGRFLAVLLMAGGLFVLGVTSATVISAFNDELKRLEHRRKHPGSAHKHGREHSVLLNTLSLGAATPVEVLEPEAQAEEAGKNDQNK